LKTVEGALNSLINRISNDDRSKFQEVVRDVRQSWWGAQERLHNEFYDNPYRAEPRIERYEQGPILDPTPGKKFAKEFDALQEFQDRPRRFNPHFNPLMSSPISATSMQPASLQTAPLSMPGLLREVLKGGAAKQPVGLLEYLVGQHLRTSAMVPAMH
jgi:hypothetical protein